GKIPHIHRHHLGPGYGVQSCLHERSTLGKARHVRGVAHEHSARHHPTCPCAHPGRHGPVALSVTKPGHSTHHVHSLWARHVIEVTGDELVRRAVVETTNGAASARGKAGALRRRAAGGRMPRVSAWTPSSRPSARCAPRVRSATVPIDVFE